MADVDVALTVLAIAAALPVVTALPDARTSLPRCCWSRGHRASSRPFIEVPELTADVVLLGLLPPPLYATAIRTSLIDFRADIRSIGASVGAAGGGDRSGASD